MRPPFEFNPVFRIPPDQQTQLPHVIVPDAPDAVLDFASLFGRAAPLEIDLGCGKGRFAAARAAAFPEHNFLAVEKQLGRIHTLQSKLLRLGLENVRMLRVEAAHVIKSMIPKGSIHTCYIFFPDPWPKRRHSRRRLFTETFQSALWEALAEKGRLNFATDQLPYFEQVDKSLAADPRFVRTEAFVTAEHERSEFEQIFLNKGQPIGRCSFIKA